MIYFNFYLQLLYEPVDFYHESLDLNKSTNYIIIDETCSENDFENQSFKLDGKYLQIIHK